MQCCLHQYSLCAPDLLRRHVLFVAVPSLLPSSGELCGSFWKAFNHALSPWLPSLLLLLLLRGGVQGEGEGERVFN